MGRGAVNQKGPETACLSALRAFKAAKVKLPVNLVLVCEGEEEIGSPHFPEIVKNPKVMAELKKCMGVFMPSADQGPDGSVEISLGAKGVVELELVSTGEKWGRGPKHDVHSSLEATVDSPTWHLVQALNTLIQPDGHTPAVAGFFDKAKPLTPAQVNMIKAVIARRSEETLKKQLGVEHWTGDKNYLDAMMALESQPTINIEGLVAGYTGPGGKTVLGHRAVAKIDMRLVPDMTADGTLALLKEHLAKKGFGDIEVNMSGGYDPNQTSTRQQAHPDADFDLQETRAGSDAVAALCRLVAGLHLYQPAAQPARRPLRPRPRHRRTRPKRVLPDRFDQPKGLGLGWSCGVVCRVPVRAGVVERGARER